MADKIVYTGAIDAYFEYQLGALEYRSVRFETEVNTKREGGISRPLSSRKELSAMMKNYDIATVLTMKEQVAYQPGQVVSKTLAQNDAVSVTLFAFDKGEEISTHESGGDALVLCLDGEGRITVDGVEHILHEGESILMPARHPHAVSGQERFKMLLVVVF